MTDRVYLIEGGDTLAQASYLSVLTGALRGYGVLNLTEASDIYAFTIHQPGNLDFSLTRMSENANIQLLNSNGTMISGSFNPGTQDEYKTYQNITPGDYYFKIYSGYQYSGYELNFELKPKDPGSSLTQALNLGLITEAKKLFGSLSATDKLDIYRFKVDRTGNVEYSLTGLALDANIQLLNSNGNIITGSYNTGTQDEYKIHKNLTAGDYYFKIYSGGNTNYNFNFEFYEEVVTSNGTDGNDSIRGREREDRIYGGNGNDSLSGYDGNDTVYGENKMAMTLFMAVTVTTNSMAEMVMIPYLVQQVMTP
jgi:hypothetical protein